MATLCYPGPIHGDFHEHNILAEGNECQGHKIIGFIDLQDAAIGCRVSDLAVYMMHMMAHCVSTIEPADVGKLCINGYRRKRSLTEEEFDVLYDCVLGRFAQYLVYSPYYYSIHKDPYLITSKTTGRRALGRLREKSRSEIMQYWKCE